MEYKQKICIVMLFFTVCVMSFSNVGYKNVSKLKSQAKVGISNKRIDELKVLYMPPASEYNYYRTIGKGIEKYSKELGIAYSMLAPQIDNPSNQLKLLENVVEQNKADMIIFATHDPVLVAPLIKKAVDNGIMVVLVNSDIPDFDTPIHAVVGYNQRNGAKKVGEYLKTTGNKNSKIGILEGAPGYHSTERVEGFLEGIKSEPSLEVVSKKKRRLECCRRV